MSNNQYKIGIKIVMPPFRFAYRASIIFFNYNYSPEHGLQVGLPFSILTKHIFNMLMILITFFPLLSGHSVGSWSAGSQVHAGSAQSRYDQR